MRPAILALVSLTLYASGLRAITIHVPGDYPTIQQGIEAAENGDTVLVAPGGYPEHIDFLGKEIVVKSAQGPEVTTITWNQPQHVVSFESGEGSGAVIEGFTINNTYTWTGQQTSVRCGAGTAPVIRGNHLINGGNIWSGFGGGVQAQSSSPLIEENRIVGNQCCYYGGGIYLNNCTNAVVRNNFIAANYVWSGYGVSKGGGIYAVGSSAVIERNLIAYNICDPPYGAAGGGIALEMGGSYQIHNNTLYGNESVMPGQYTGGGVNKTGSARLDLQDNIIVMSLGGGIVCYPEGSSSVIADFNDVWNNDPFNYFGLTPGPGDLCADPLFVGGSPYSYELTEDSPCIDAGSFSSDPDPDGTRSDMGAFYFDQEGMHVAIVADSWPIVIPTAGGSFGYTLHLTNYTSSPSQFDLWIDALLPDSTVYGPIILRQNLMVAPQAHQERHVTQAVPGGAPEGGYLYMAHIGDYSTGEIIHETLMPFSKEGSTRMAGSWTTTPQLDDWGHGGVAQTNLPLPSFQIRVHPNPFNPITTLSLTLPSPGLARLEVFDVNGRAVWAHSRAPLQYTAGEHHILFDGLDLPSGIYLAWLTAGDWSAVQKMVLMK